MRRRAGNNNLLGGFQKRRCEHKVPRPGTAQRLRHADEHSGRHFPDRGLFIGWLAGTANGSGAEPFLFSPEGEQIFNPSASSPRSTGVPGLSLVSGVSSLRTELKHVIVLAAPWRCGRREEFDNRSRSDQGQGNIQQCHHASDKAQPVPPPVFLFTPLRGSL